MNRIKFWVAPVICIAMAMNGCAKYPYWHSWLDPSKTIAVTSQDSEVVPIFPTVDPLEDEWDVLPNAEPPTMEDLVASDEDYRIGPRDVIGIGILDLFAEGSEYRTQLVVSNEGYIQLPLLESRTKVLGMTAPEVRDVVAAAYSPDWLLDPQVSVEVVGRRQNYFTIRGAIARPGVYEIVRRDYRILEALTTAGDLTAANLDLIYVIRRPEAAPGELLLSPMGVKKKPAEPRPTPQKPSEPDPATEPDSLKGESELIEELRQYMPEAAQAPEIPQQAQPAPPAEEAAPPSTPTPAVQAEPVMPEGPAPSEPELPTDDGMLPPVEVTPEEVEEPDSTEPEEQPQDDPMAELERALAPPAPRPATRPARPVILRMSETDSLGGGVLAQNDAAPVWRFEGGKLIMVRPGEESQEAAPTQPATAPAEPPALPDASQPAPAAPAVERQPAPSGQAESSQEDPDDPFGWAQEEMVDLSRIIAIDATSLLNGEQRQNIVVRDGDTILVPRPVVGEFYVSGEVPRPGVYSLTGRKLTLKQGLAAAGGFGPLAWPSNSLLIRRIGDDQEIRQPIRLDLIMAGKEPDIMLKPDDHILVGTHAVAPFLAVARNAFRATYGVGFLYDRNFAEADFGQSVSFWDAMSGNSDGQTRP